MAKGNLQLETFKGLRKVHKWSFLKALRMTYGDDQGRAVKRIPNRKKK
jgi:hypothetical protein